ncbi:MAG TPA: metallophosphoesterase [Coleofasciculaceae cyanobacterium]|jgi:predicted phosphodiesterase
MILFSGDPHGDFTPVIRAVETHSPQAVILLGDFDLERSLEQELSAILDKTEIWFIPGNHDGDHDHWYDNLFNSGLGDRNLHGRVVEIDGKRVAGLGGVFRQKIWMPPAQPKFRTQNDLLYTCQKKDRWRNGIPRKHHVTIFWQTYKTLRGKRADILVTHEAPSSHRYGFKELDDLAQALGANTVFHGHHHEHYSRTICDHQILVHGVGEAGVSDEHGNVLIAGKQDEQRQIRWYR